MFSIQRFSSSKYSLQIWAESRIQWVSLFQVFFCFRPANTLRTNIIIERQISSVLLLFPSFWIISPYFVLLSIQPLFIKACRFLACSGYHRRCWILRPLPHLFDHTIKYSVSYDHRINKHQCLKSLWKSMTYFLPAKGMAFTCVSNELVVLFSCSLHRLLYSHVSRNLTAEVHSILWVKLMLTFLRQPWSASIDSDKMVFWNSLWFHTCILVNLRISSPTCKLNGYSCKYNLFYSSSVVN